MTALDLVFAFVNLGFVIAMYYELRTIKQKLGEVKASPNADGQENKRA